ncbi:hypothetical protein Q7P37_002322 [Cladosporium fusiforme]
MAEFALGPKIREHPVFRPTEEDEPKILLHKTLVALRDYHSQRVYRRKTLPWNSWDSRMLGVPTLLGFFCRIHEHRGVEVLNSPLHYRRSTLDFVIDSTELWMKWCLLEDDNVNVDFEIGHSLVAVRNAALQLLHATGWDDQYVREQSLEEQEKERISKIHLLLLDVFDMMRTNMLLDPTSEIGLDEIAFLAQDMDFILLFPDIGPKSQWNEVNASRDINNFAKFTFSIAAQLRDWQDLPRIEAILTRIVRKVVPDLYHKNGFDLTRFCSDLETCGMGYVATLLMGTIQRTAPQNDPEAEEE